MTLGTLLAAGGWLVLAAAITILLLENVPAIRRRGLEALDEIRWRRAAKVGLAAIPLLLLASSIVVVPAGMAGVVVSQFSGALPGTLYPGTHWLFPLIESVELYDTRDHVFTTSKTDAKGRPAPSLAVLTREGLEVKLAVTVRYRIDPRRLDGIHANLPRPLDENLVTPVVSNAFRETAPRYLVRELFAAKRDEVRALCAGQITKRLASDGIVVKEVLLQDLLLPSEYAKGLESLLLKEQENERLTFEVEIKQKLVRTAELEAEAQKARQVKQAEADAASTVLQAKAQADAMQYTLPLKEKQIEQTRLEAEARKQATIKNAEAMAEAKVIDSRAELERGRLMAQNEANRIRTVAAADAERMKTEAAALKDSPLLIQKIIAERLSDRVQIMMVPADGKFFFNDVIKGSPITSMALSSGASK